MAASVAAVDAAPREGMGTRRSQPPFGELWKRFDTKYKDTGMEVADERAGEERARLNELADFAL